MRRTAALLTAALAASTAIALGAAAPAYAAAPENCADAITALNQADADHRAAVDADKAAADADAADDELDRAEDRLKDAQEDLRIARDALTQAQKRVDGPPLLTGQELKDAKTARDRAKDDVDDAQDKVDDLKDARDDAKDAADSDELALRDKADETDADALAKALDNARSDFTRLCTGGEADPTSPTTTPSTAEPAPADNDEAQDSSAVRTPRGGVATGGGPA